MQVVLQTLTELIVHGGLGAVDRVEVPPRQRNDRVVVLAQKHLVPGGEQRMNALFEVI